jgi:alpha,alpha-trehalase
MEAIDRSLKNLFVDLQLSGLWTDEKAISDALLKFPAREILANYEAEKELPEFNLKSFFFEHFEFPVNKASGFESDLKKSPEAHIEALWPFLHKPAEAQERSTKIALPKSYVVPGGRFQEVYYWDSYFTQLGLLLSNKHEWVEDILDNFAYLIRMFGHIPNGNRSYFITRSQPPFFALMVDSYAKATDDPERVYKKYLTSLIQEYEFWLQPVRTRINLTRYYDSVNTPRVEMYKTDLEWTKHTESHPDFYRNLRAACESGWDFSSRWLKDSQDLGSIRTLDLLPVDLNSLLFFHEKLLAKIIGSKQFEKAAEARKKSLQTLFFCPLSGFHDYNFVESRRMTEHTTAAMLFPLFVGAANKIQAEVVAKTVFNELLQAGGLTTTTCHSVQQWDAPNGWAPLQWIAIKGLRKYGYDELALEIGKRWIASCDHVYHTQGKFVEKYNVYDPTSMSSGGEYELQDGFGWSNGVYLAIKAELGL